MKKGLVLAVVAALSVACASSGPPASPALLAETEAAVRRAEAAAAGERAPDLMAKAQRAWDEGRLASGRGEGTIAIRRLEEAREYARAAEAQANAARLASEVATLKQQADELEAKTRQMRSTPTP
jgi:multidrug resistance efflux pump